MWSVSCCILYIYISTKLKYIVDFVDETTTIYSYLQRKIVVNYYISTSST